MVCASIYMCVCVCVSVYYLLRNQAWFRFWVFGAVAGLVLENARILKFNAWIPFFIYAVVGSDLNGFFRHPYACYTT